VISILSVGISREVQGDEPFVALLCDGFSNAMPVALKRITLEAGEGYSMLVLGNPISDLIERDLILR
jgi:hypothetical protein